MRVSELWRYPVKSLQGEQVQSATVTHQGIEGDRAFAIFDTTTGFGLTARRVPELLFASAQLRQDGRAEIVLPDGTVSDGDGALSDWLGRRVALRAAAEQDVRRYENPADFENEESTPWEPFDGSRGAFHDSSRAAVSLVSWATMAGSSPRRFRANVVLDAAGEDAFVGGAIAIGDVRLSVGRRIPRCVMVTRPQPGGVDRDLDVLRVIHREREGCLAVGATVDVPGTLEVGETVHTT